MKRSKMEREIQRKMEEFALDQEQGRWRASIEILQLVELYGMLPPAIINPMNDLDIKNEYDHATKKALAELYNFDPPGEFKVNQWEPEDEK